MRLHKKLGIGALVCALSLQVFAFAPSVSLAADSKLTISSEEIITSGALVKKYVWSTTRNKTTVTANASVIEVDLTNPNVKLDAMSGSGSEFTKKATVLEMTKNSGAVAGINGDFYNTQAEGVPIGPQITEGEILSTTSNLSGMYAFGITKDNVPVVDQFTFTGSLKAADGASFPLKGVNTTYYYDDNKVFSHQDAIYMYTSAWTQNNRSNDGTTKPTEVLVQNGIITKIAVNGVIPMVAPEDGYILRASGKGTDYVVQHLKEGDPLISNYEMKAKDAWKQYDVNNFKMMIGGSTLLVDEGKAMSYFTRDIGGIDGYRYRSRTAIGYSKNLKTAYLITVDNSGSSKGVNMVELQQIMVQAGVWRGMVLDGGGSTQMVARPLGEFDSKLVNKVENNYQRKVANGVGVYTLAPQGEVKGLTLKGQDELFIGETSSYQMKGYDEYYNPIASFDGIVMNWSSSAALGTFEGNAFTATKSGKTKLTAKSGKGSATIDVDVIGRDQISAMKINAGDISLSEGQSYKLPIMVTTKSGITREVPPQLISWELQGIGGEIGKDGVLRVTNLSGSQSAQLIARYDGYSTILTMPIGQEQLWYDLDTTGVKTTASKYPAEVVSAVNTDASTGNKNLKITYDFTLGTGTKAAYADFNDKYGAPITGEPQYIKVKVQGDESMNWLRAEFSDAAGKTHMVDLTQNINWKGWQQLTANLTDYNMKYPITIKKIYVVSPEQGQDERALKGEVRFDDVTFVYKGKLPSLPYSKVKLTVNKKTGILNNKSITLEQAPIITSGNTMIPIRFVTEALGGTVKWDEKERKVTILRGDKLIELWIGKTDIVVNGDRVTAEVAPRIANDMTLVPLRIISEKLGWKVGWEPVGQVITLE
ncbi:phosphodiester glycosidase family protein [Paenibacillus eucommiae]|uniref:Exopolysaccharide biosynthesis protein n=1 Tax=Paenibacillus eucommiae TaxID=1355755 RepID=A0ABS4IYG8_9BACL|nr:stalk domain-containing protein [Paenibacillus eucommiae]MBP1992631.1 exopolysaccharide biosynthesis protein [Paenibacillus eucommiae]